MHPLLFIALVCKQHVITFNHSILSEINYPHIHLLNCYHSTTIEDLFLFFASPNSSTTTIQLSSPSQQQQQLSSNSRHSIKTPSESFTSPTSPRLSLNHDQINTIMNTLQNNSNNHNLLNITSITFKESIMIGGNDESSIISNNSTKQHKRSSSLAMDNNTILNTVADNSLPQSSIINSTSNNNTNININTNNTNNSNTNNGNNIIESSNGKRNSVKGSHNKNIFSFDDRYYVFNEINSNNISNNNVNNSNVNNHFHNNVHSMNDGNNNLVPSVPFNQQLPFSLQKRTSILSKRHFKQVNSPFVSQPLQNNTDNSSNILDLQVKTNERKFRILILNNFRSVSKRVKFTLLEIFKYKKVILGDKIFDIPYEFICICDTLELPSPLLNEFIGFVPTLCTNATATPQDIQNYSTNIQHIIQQQLNRMNEQTNLIDCVDMTVKIYQYIREIIIQCRNHHSIRKYPTSESIPHTVMACKAYALIFNKTFVTPTHVQSIISNLLYHRIECLSEDKWNVIQQVVSNVLPP